MFVVFVIYDIFKIIQYVHSISIILLFWNILLICPKTVNLDILDEYFLIFLTPVIFFH